MLDDASKHAAEANRCMVDLDVAGYRKLWRHLAPHLAQPRDDHEAAITLHHARTQAESVPLRLRAYSHRWLLDRGYPSGLPDRLKPSAEQLCPRVVEATGFSMQLNSGIARRVLAPMVGEITAAVQDVIMDEYSGRRVDHDRLRGRMLETKDAAVRRLAGRLAKN